MHDHDLPDQDRLDPLPHDANAGEIPGEALDEILDARLSHYLVGELEEADRRAVEQALERDPALRAELEARRRSLELVRAAGGPALELGETRRAELLSSVAASPAPDVPVRPLPRRLLAVSWAAMLVLGAGWVWFLSTAPWSDVPAELARGDEQGVTVRRIAGDDFRQQPGSEPRGTPAPEVRESARSAAPLAASETRSQPDGEALSAAGRAGSNAGPESKRDQRLLSGGGGGGGGGGSAASGGYDQGFQNLGKSPSEASAFSFGPDPTLALPANEYGYGADGQMNIVIDNPQLPAKQVMPLEPGKSVRKDSRKPSTEENLRTGARYRSEASTEQLARRVRELSDNTRVPASGNGASREPAASPEATAGDRELEQGSARAGSAIGERRVRRPAPAAEAGDDAVVEYQDSIERAASILEQLRRRPGETPEDMFFRYWGDNPFVPTSRDPLSTFGLDVDTASYQLARSYLNRGVLPPPAAIRTEEFVNSFPSRYQAPTATDLALHVELAPSPFAHQEGVQLLKVGIKAREVDPAARGPLALTLVIDVSGSMQREGRLELVKDGIRSLLTELRPDDTIAIVTFRTSAQQVLEPTRVEQVDRILGALTSLVPQGSTNLQAGLALAFPLAQQAYRADGHNRIVIFSDGVANTGITDVEGILASVADQRSRGIFLNTFGVGMGNHNDHLLEQLADRGDGVCAYIDSLAEATRIFRRALTGTFVTVARNAKVQLVFDPEAVVAFRQIGYENRALAHQDFRNDAVDAGEIGAGHEVVALYELELRPGTSRAPGTVRLRYESVPPAAGDAGEMVELEQGIPARGITDFENASPRFRLSACVAAFAEHLRQSYWSRSSELAEVIERAATLRVLDGEQEQPVAGFLDLARRTEGLLAARAELTAQERLLDELRRNHYLRARCEDLGSPDVHELLEDLARQNQLLEERLKQALRQ